MAKVFISHSSADRRFTNKLAKDLSTLGHEVWFDEWQIDVGDDIPHNIEKGLSECDFIIVILTTKAINSGWVEREWKTKIWDEVKEKKTIVLPALMEDCDIPELLRSKRYADFRSSYAVGLVQINNKLIKNSNPNDVPGINEILDGIIKLVDLIKRDAPDTNIIMAFDRSGGILASALSQIMHLPEILVVNRSIREYSANDLTGLQIEIGTGVQLDAAWLNAKKIAVVKYHMLTGDTTRNGLAYLRNQGLREDPPVFALYSTAHAIKRLPQLKWIYEHPDPQATLSRFPWNRVDVHLI